MDLVLAALVVVPWAAAAVAAVQSDQASVVALAVVSALVLVLELVLAPVLVMGSKRIVWGWAKAFGIVYSVEVVP